MTGPVVSAETSAALDEHVTVRFPEHLAAAAKAEAAREGMNASEWIRHLIGREVARREAPGSPQPSPVPDDTTRASMTVPEPSRERTGTVLPLDRESLREIVRNAVANWWTGPVPSERITEALWPMLEHAQSAAAGSHEGIRLWMLDCGALVQKHREHVVGASTRLGEQRARAELAEAKLANVRAYCEGWLSSHPCCPEPAEDILSAIGSEEGDDGR